MLTLLDVLGKIAWVRCSIFRGEPNMILEFPDFSLTFEEFLISLTILQNSLTFHELEEKTNFPDQWAP